MTPLTFPAAHSDQRSRVIPVEALRRQTLARLQRRLRTVDELIRSLEHYERERMNPSANCTPINQSRKCS